MILNPILVAVSIKNFGNVHLITYLLHGAESFLRS